jgi:hypothetical protein
MAVVSQLFPWDRWQLLLQYPRNQRLSSWNCHPDLSIKREPLKKQAMRGFERLPLERLFDEEGLL